LLLWRVRRDKSPSEIPPFGPVVVELRRHGGRRRRAGK
jgi:hypothetical protein